jgi:hypothetical protein
LIEGDRRREVLRRFPRIDRRSNAAVAFALAADCVEEFLLQIARG